MEDLFTKKLVDVGLRQLLTSSDFKKPRMDKIRSYEDVYNGKEKPRLRIQFAVPLPVLPGMVDSLRADFDDELALRFKAHHPADFKIIDQTQKVFDTEVSSLRPNARWDLKVRWDKFMAIMSGRAIQKTFAESNGGFRLNFDTEDYRYFHCEPKGGGLLANHIFKGAEGIFKTKSQLEDGARDGIYDAEGVKAVIAAGQNPQHKTEMENAYEDKLNRFASLGFNTENNNYVGETLYNLCEWQMQYKGKKWYMLFDPWSKKAIRVEENKKLFESNLDMWTSWATHEDPKVFWTPGYCDYFYPIHDAIFTLLNQELTNRQRRNLGAKAVDPEMFTDLMALDDANSRPDKIVPVRVPTGKSISDGIFMFETPELQGTINLVEWLQKATSTATGVNEINEQASGKGGGAQVMFTSLQSASKRLNYKAKSFQEAYAEVGLRAQHGIFENLSEEECIKIIGVDGQGWLPKVKGRVDAKVISITEQDKENIFGKDQKIKAVDRILASETLIKENNPKKLNEFILKNIGGLKDDEIEDMMDTQGFNTDNITAKADIAILKLRKGKMPPLVYDANIAFYERINKFEKDNQNELKEKVLLFREYLNQHIEIIKDNMMSLADKLNMEKSIPENSESIPANSLSDSIPQRVGQIDSMSNMEVGGMG